MKGGVGIMMEVDVDGGHGVPVGYPSSAASIAGSGCPSSSESLRLGRGGLGRKGSGTTTGVAIMIDGTPLGEDPRPRRDDRNCLEDSD